VRIAQTAAPVPNLGERDVAFRQEVAAQAVRDLAGIDPIIFLLSQSDGAQHHRVKPGWSIVLSNDSEDLLDDYSYPETEVACGE